MDTRISVHDRGPYPELEPYRGKVSEDEITAIYEQEQMGFWDTAQELAKEHGFDGVYQEGRSGGWAEPFPQVPDDHSSYAQQQREMEELAQELHTDMEYRRGEFLRRVAAVADVVGVYE